MRVSWAPDADLSSRWVKCWRGPSTSNSSATVRQIGIVAWRCRTCGTVDLYIGTSKVGTLNLYKAGTATRGLLTLTRFKSNKTGKVSVRVTTSGKLVKIDALALSRT